MHRGEYNARLPMYDLANLLILRNNLLSMPWPLPPLPRQREVVPRRRSKCNIHRPALYIMGVTDPWRKCLGTTKKGERCGQMIPWYRGDYCRWHSDQAPIFIEQQPEPVKQVGFVEFTPFRDLLVILGITLILGISFNVAPEASTIALGSLVILWFVSVLG